MNKDTNVRLYQDLDKVIKTKQTSELFFEGVLDWKRKDHKIIVGYDAGLKKYHALWDKKSLCASKGEIIEFVSKEMKKRGFKEKEDALQDNSFTLELDPIENNPSIVYTLGLCIAYDESHTNDQENVIKEKIEKNNALFFETRGDYGFLKGLEIGIKSLSDYPSEYERVSKKLQKDFIVADVEEFKTLLKDCTVEYDEDQEEIICDLDSISEYMMEDEETNIDMYYEISLKEELFETIEVTAKGTDQNEWQDFKLVLPVPKENLEEFMEDKKYIEASLESLFNMYTFMFWITKETTYTIDGDEVSGEKMIADIGITADITSNLDELKESVKEQLLEEAQLSIEDIELIDKTDEPTYL